MDGEPFVECSVDGFIARYLPFNTDDAKVDAANVSGNATLTTVLSDMVDLSPPSWQQHSRSTGALEHSTVSRLTTDYYNEATAYRSYVQDTVDAIGDMKFAGRTRNDFRYCATDKSDLGTQRFSNGVDGCIVSGRCVTPNSELDIRTTGVAVVFGFGLEEMGDDEIENNKKVVRANIKIMNEDARRMWSYGVTVFGKMVRLWYHDRSHSAVSELFDFVENPKLLINVIISFLFATELELGYDPKVTRMPDNRLVFEIADNKNKSKPRFYRTIRTLSGYHSDRIAGRACRVWEVEQVSNADGTGDVLSRGVLKDVWVDKGTLTEREIQDALFKAIEDRKADVDSHKGMKEVMGSAKLLELVHSGEYKKFFLTIVADCVGLSSKRVALGAQRRLGLLCLEMDSYSSTSGETKPQWKVKRQSRTVSAELCVTVGRMGTMGQVLDVLSQALTALRIMYFAGWVHRDVSSGNVMAYRSGSKGDGTPTWQTKLCDLEYAKEYTVDAPVTSQETKIGTPYFMATEIMWGELLLPPEPAKPHHTRTSTVPLSLKDEEIETRARIKAEREAYRKARLAARRATEQRTVLMNVIPSFQHDLESIWWLTIYSATARADHPPSNDFADKVFRHTTQLSMDRAVCLLEPIIKGLERCLHPDLLVISCNLEDMRNELLSEYRKRNAARRQNGTSDDTESFADIINEFYVAFYDLVSSASEDDKLRNFPLSNAENIDVVVVIEPEPSKKRPRSTVEDGEHRDEFEDGREDRYADDAKLKKTGGAKRAKNIGED